MFIEEGIFITMILMLIFEAIDAELFVLAIFAFNLGFTTVTNHAIDEKRFVNAC